MSCVREDSNVTALCNTSPYLSRDVFITMETLNVGGRKGEEWKSCLSPNNGISLAYTMSRVNQRERFIFLSCITTPSFQHVVNSKIQKKLDLCLLDKKHQSSCPCCCTGESPPPHSCSGYQQGYK